MHLVEGGAALRQLAERWKQKPRWAFTVLHSPVEPGAKGLALPPLPGMCHPTQIAFVLKLQHVGRQGPAQKILTC